MVALVALANAKLSADGFRLGLADCDGCGECTKCDSVPSGCKIGSLIGGSCDAIGCSTCGSCSSSDGCIGCGSSGCDSVGGCISCDASGCDSMIGCDSGCDSLGCLGGSLGDPWSLFPSNGALNVGGWLQFGYHDRANVLFNSHPDRVNLHQAWLYAEKQLDTSNGFDIGGRIDYVYGVDAQNTQAFGISNSHWDNDWDNGIYGHALPQLYLEAGYGDWSVKAGHFYTIIGYEVVTAPDNFFYSHAYTFNFSEPFTHTGALATYSASDKLDVYGGHVLGWDSGFEDNGDAFLGGASLDVTDSFNLTYAASGGVFRNNVFDGTLKGYMHSIVGNMQVSDNLNWVIQSDLLDVESNVGIVENTETFGINNYLFYTVSDKLALGTRFEWYNVEEDTAGTDIDIYALTTGFNYRPHSNIIVRPEVRWDWDDTGSVPENGEDRQTTFGIDTIFTF